MDCSPHSFVNVDMTLVSIKLEVWRPSFAYSRNVDALIGTESFAYLWITPGLRKGCIVGENIK